MSVPKSQRGDSEVEFIYAARQLELYTIRKCVSLPKRYTFYLSQPLANDAKRIHDDVKMANSIFPMNAHEAQVRRADTAKNEKAGYDGSGWYSGTTGFIRFMAIMEGLCSPIQCTSIDSLGREAVPTVYESNRRRTSKWNFLCILQTAQR